MRVVLCRERIRGACRTTAVLHDRLFLKIYRPDKKTMGCLSGCYGRCQKVGGHVLWVSGFLCAQNIQVQ